MEQKKYTSADLFSGVGGLSVGLRRAGFKVSAAVEIEPHAIQGYKLNFPDTKVIAEDIRQVDASDFLDALKGQKLHLLAGCPPCQGFSSIRRLNKKKSVKDERNSLVLEYYRLVEELEPLTIMMENVPGLVNYYLYKKVLFDLRKLGYEITSQVVDVKDYGVPQRRKRLVLLGSKLGKIEIAPPVKRKMTVRKALEGLESVSDTSDAAHKIYAQHSDEVLARIKQIPKNGGSWKDLPVELHLACHKKKNVGFGDVYGRLRWEDYSSTITGGCLNPSKGRFLHPEEDRCITAREAALLQSFPKRFKFPLGIPKDSIALMIGNALPPRFSYYQSKEIMNHLKVSNIP